MDFMVCVYGDNGEEAYFPEINRLGAGVELQSYGFKGAVSMRAWEDRLALHSSLRPKIAGRAAVHGPFIGIAYDHRDCLLMEATRKRMDMTFDVVKHLKPDTLVMHSGITPLSARSEEDAWVEAVSAFWKEEIRRYKAIGVRVVLENTAERSPDTLARLLDAVNDTSLGICLDVGHANYASDFKPCDWVQPLSRWLRHIHLHDNNGREDEHLPVGKGNIDFQKLFSAFERYTPDVTVSLEVEEKPAVILENFRLVLSLVKSPGKK